jgi:hypothetical protein
MAIENRKKNMFLAYFILNISFLAINSQQKKGY